MRVEGHATMYVENELVVNSVTMLESRPKKKHFSICYHAVCEAVDVSKVRIGWVPTGINLADFLTKVLDGPNICEVVGKILY